MSREFRRKITDEMKDSPISRILYAGYYSVEVWDDRRNGWVMIGHPREICKQESIREYIETQYAISVLQGGEIGPPF